MYSLALDDLNVTRMYQ